LQEEFSQSEETVLNKQYIGELMEDTFHHRQKYIHMHNSNPTDISREWPCLFMYDEVCLILIA